MPQSYIFTTDAVGADEEIRTRGYVHNKIVIGEDNQAGTADYKLRLVNPDSPDATAPQITRPAGARTEIAAPKGGWKPGTLVAYICASSGSLTMAQEEY